MAHGLGKLKRDVEGHFPGQLIGWIDTPYYGGSAWADLPDGTWVSLLADPPGNTPQTGGTFKNGKEPGCKEMDEGWKRRTVEQMRLLFT